MEWVTPRQNNKYYQDVLAGKPGKRYLERKRRQEYKQRTGKRGSGNRD